MSNNQPLQNETIVLTGTSITGHAQSQIEAFGGEALHLPLIEVAEVQSTDDHLFLQRSQEVEWLIFTSQNAVHAFIHKMTYYGYEASMWSEQRIAVVGEKTAEALELAGFSIHFVPTTYSADAMVKELNRFLELDTTCLFVRGSMAKDTIPNGLKCRVETWTIYETRPTKKSIPELKEQIQHKNCTVVFASPSAVRVYAEEILPIYDWEKITVAAIGHVTEKALMALGAWDIIQPKTYTMQQVVEEIARRKESSI